MRFTGFGVLVIAMACAPLRGQVIGSAPRDAAELFQPLWVWSVELRLTPEAFAAMEPQEGAGMWSLMGAMMGGRQGPPPADLLAAAMIRRGDRDRDGRLDRGELDSLSDRWFTLWDNTRAGRLDLETLRAGLKATLDPEGTFESRFPVFLRGADGRGNGLASVLGIDFTIVRATAVFEGAAIEDVGLRYKGNGTFLESRATSKRPLKLELNHFDKGRRLAGLSRLNLHNNVTDASGMVEPVSLALFRDAGVPAPRTSYAQVYLTVPGRHDQKYLGLYSVVENVDKDFARDRFGSGDGAIFKPVTPNLFADLGDEWPAFKQAYDPRDEPTDAQARRVIEFSKLMSYATDADLAARIGEFLDLDQFARFMAVTVYLASVDSILQIGQNYYLHLDTRTNRFVFIPWDHDHSFGRIFGNQDELARMSIHTPWPAPNRFLERVYNVPAFKELYLARLREFADTIFSPERLAARVDAIAASIRPSVEGESPQKLAQFDQAVADAPRRRALKFVRAFSRLRTQSILDQLSGKEQGVRPRTFGPGAGRPAGGSTTAPQGRTLAAAMVAVLDADRDGQVARLEFKDGLGGSFAKWSASREEGLTEQQLRDGIRADIFPPAAGASPPGNTGR